MPRTGSPGSALALILLLAAAGCGDDDDAPGPSGTGGASSTGGRGGSTAGTGGSSATGGSGGSAGGSTGGSGGSAATGGSGGGSATDAKTGADGSGGPSETGSDVPAGGDSGGSAPGPADYGGVGQRPRVLLQYTDSPVPPLVPSECAEDPTVGFTEYRDGFVVQRPHNLAAADRFKYENGIYSFWVQSGDQPHQPGNTTEPRVEARYSDFTTGEHIWSADVMYETPSKTCVMQIHNTVAAIAMYLRVQGNRMFNLSTGKTILTDYEKKWFNLKVAFNTQTLEVRIFVNNCLKETSRAPRGTPNWYFKNGVYTCDSGTCRSNFKNVHLYQKGSTDTFPMPKAP